jgi:hypothetical protein
MITGFNLNKACANDRNSALVNTSELDKVGSAAAATIFTLLPSLLTFAPMLTARISHLIYSSPLIAFLTGGVIFGFPVAQYDVVQEQRIFTADEFLKLEHSEQEPDIISSIHETADPPRLAMRVWN